MAQKPNLTLQVNLPCILRFPFAAEDGGVDPSWSGPSKQDPSKTRHQWTVEVARDQAQYPAGQYALWGSDSLKALIDAAWVNKDSWLQLAHLQVGQAHSWEAYIWNSQAENGKGTWDKVPDPGPLPAPGPEGAASSPPAYICSQPASAPAPTSPAAPAARGANRPPAAIADTAGHTAWDLEHVGACFLIMARKAFEAAKVTPEPGAVQDYASTLMIQASKLQLPMPWAPEEETRPREEAAVGSEDDDLPF